MATQETVDTTKKTELNGSEGTLDYEKLASEIGWAPQDKFRGDPEKWRDAKTFYEKGEFVLPLVKKQRDEYRKDADQVRNELAEVKKAMKEFQAFTEAAAERKVTDLKAEIAALKDTRAAAVESGDKVAFRQADDAIDARTEALAAAKEVKKEVKETPKTVTDPDFEGWLAENRWYVDDPQKKKLADEYGIYYSNVDGLKGKPLYDAVAKKMKSLEAEESGTERAGPQRGGKASGSNSKAKTFDNLLPEYKKAFERFQKNDLKMTKEQYMANCDSDAWGA